MEEWKPIPGFEEYEVSNFGRVKHNICKGNRAIKYISTKTSHGYRRVSLKQKEGGYKVIFVHRLVADAFLEKIAGKDTVDHINRNRADNRVENLRWADHSDQNRNKYRTVSKSGHKYIQPTHANTYVIQFTIKTLEDALRFRDDIISQHPNIVDGVWGSYIA